MAADSEENVALVAVRWASPAALAMYATSLIAQLASVAGWFHYETPLSALFGALPPAFALLVWPRGLTRIALVILIGLRAFVLPDFARRCYFPRFFALWWTCVSALALLVMLEFIASLVFVMQNGDVLLTWPLDEQSIPPPNVILLSLRALRFYLFGLDVLSATIIGVLLYYAQWYIVPLYAMSQVLTFVTWRVSNAKSR